MLFRSGLRVLESAQFKEGITPYREFAQHVRERVERFHDVVTDERQLRRRIWGYGANAKGAVLLQAAEIFVSVERIVDDTEAKWGYQMPGVHIPITDAKDLSEPDVLILLSWNNAKDLKAKAHERGFKGRFLLPHPPYFEDAGESLP